MGAILRKYATGTGADIYIPIIKAGVLDFAVSGDWTPAASDVKVSKDGGTDTNIGTLPVFTNGSWKFVFTDAELTAAFIVVKVVDAATKAVEDQTIIIETYGNASAQHAFDLDTAAVTVAANGINDAALDADVDTYQAKVWLIDDDTGTNDRYVVAFFKNGQPITAGVTIPDLWVFTAAASPSDLVGTSGAPQALTEVGTTETWFHNEASSRIADGTAYMARIRFTVDGSQRTWYQPIGRDT